MWKKLMIAGGVAAAACLTTVTPTVGAISWLW